MTTNSSKTSSAVYGATSPATVKRIGSLARRSANDFLSFSRNGQELARYKEIKIAIDLFRAAGPAYISPISNCCSGL